MVGFVSDMSSAYALYRYFTRCEMILDLCDELDFVGARKKLPWFNRRLAKDSQFVTLVESILNERGGASTRTVLYSLLPLSEYVAYRIGVNTSLSDGARPWKKVVYENVDTLRMLAVKHGTQGNIPQRAAIVLDYFEESAILPTAACTTIELGCSAGLLGTVLCSSEELFRNHRGSLAREYFWLKRMPHLSVPYRISYIGYDRSIPPQDLIPFFLQDTDKRERVAAFARSYSPRGLLFEQTFDSFLDTERIVSTEPVIILTAFVLYQLDEPHVLIERILELVRTNDCVHWLDLSRNSKLPCLFGQQKQVQPLVSNHIYLSHNGVQVAHVTDGSDDCPNWEYLKK